MVVNPPRKCILFLLTMTPKRASRIPSLLGEASVQPKINHADAIASCPARNRSPMEQHAAHSFSYQYVFELLSTNAM